MPPPRQNYVLSSFGYLLLCIWYGCHYSCVHKYKSSQSLLLLKTWLLNKGECVCLFFSASSILRLVFVCFLFFTPTISFLGRIFYIVLSYQSLPIFAFFLISTCPPSFFFLLLFLQILIFPFLCENQNWTAFYIKGGAQEICRFFPSVFFFTDFM